jgi:hypothetical protein
MKTKKCNWPHKENCPYCKSKNPEAVKLGSLGGKARAKKLTPKRRKEISQKANLTKSNKKLMTNS